MLPGDFQGEVWTSVFQISLCFQWKILSFELGQLRQLRHLLPTCFTTKAEDRNYRIFSSRESRKHRENPKNQTDFTTIQSIVVLARSCLKSIFGSDFPNFSTLRLRTRPTAVLETSSSSFVALYIPDTMLYRQHSRCSPTQHYSEHVFPLSFPSCTTSRSHRHTTL